MGNVAVTGTDPGLTQEEFRKKGKLKRKSKVTRETTSNALDKLRAEYQKKDHLEATVTLQKQTYDGAAEAAGLRLPREPGAGGEGGDRGGRRCRRARLHLLVPIYEEGAVDNDLLNEGTHNIKDYLQQQGYFDATVDGAGDRARARTSERVVYTVDKGAKHKVVAVDFKGNKYFDDDTLQERMRVQKADPYLRSGRYSQALVKADVDSIQALYRANGFSKAKVTPTVKDIDTDKTGKPLKVAEISGAVHDREGPQQKFGTVDLAGVDPARANDVQALLNAQEGQPFSLITLSGDRDAVLGYYVSHGFDQARVEIKQEVETDDATKTDVTLNVSEGQQVFDRPGAAFGHRPHQAERGGEPDAGACGRPAGPERAAGDAAKSVQPGAVQRGGGGGAESDGRRAREECAGADDRGASAGM